LNLNDPAFADLLVSQFKEIAEMDARRLAGVRS
jgi:uncharacterized protein (UPF0261 family)